MKWPQAARIASILLVFFWRPVSQAGADGDARFTCACEENGKPSKGTFRLLAGGVEIAAGPCGAARPVSAGSFEATVVPDGVVDTPEHRERLDVRPGKSVLVRARFETGELVVDVTRGGRRSVGMVRLLRNGARIASFGAGSANRLSTGSYGIEVESRGETKTLEAVTITRGERRVVVADFAGEDRKGSQ